MCKGIVSVIAGVIGVFLCVVIPTQAASVFFTKMTINDCKEFGTCDWWLSCALNNENEKTFFQMVEGDSGDEIEINRDLEFTSFPVTVHCTVKEHDGGISAGWEDVGSGSIVVETAGDKKIHLDNNEGDVDIEFIVHATGQQSSAFVIGNALLKIPTVGAVAWKENRLDVFARGDDRQIYQSFKDPKARRGWSEWATHSGSGTFSSGPTSVSWGDNRLDVFAMGDDRRIWQSFWDGNKWSGWAANLGAKKFTSAPAAVSWGANRIDVFARGEDRKIWRIFWNGTKWSEWTSIGTGTFSSAPAAISRGPNRLDVFAVGDDRRMYHSHWNGRSWSEWSANIGEGTFTSAPAVASWGSNRLDIFARGDNRRMYHSSWDGTKWSGWAHDTDTQGGTFTSAPAAVSPGNNKLELFALGDDRRMWHNVWNGVSWSGWKPDMGVGTFR